MCGAVMAEAIEEGATGRGGTALWAWCRGVEARHEAEGCAERLKSGRQRDDGGRLGRVDVGDFLVQSALDQA